MTAPRTAPLTQAQAWAALATHCETLRKLHLRHLFADDPHRGERLTAEAAGLYLDYSKNRVNGLHSRIEAMFRGDKIK
jgi:glucose-6-phosphate isomerase